MRSHFVYREWRKQLFMDQEANKRGRHRQAESRLLQNFNSPKALQTLMMCTEIMLHHRPWQTVQIMGEFMCICCNRNEEHVSQIKGAKITWSAFENLVYYHTLNFCVYKYGMKDYVELHKYQKIPDKTSWVFWFYYLCLAKTKNTYLLEEALLVVFVQ